MAFLTSDFGLLPKIALCASTLMYARGYTAVGVDEICRQAGVHQGSFSHCFPSKQVLVLAVLDMYRQPIQDLREAARRADCPLRERFQRAFAHA